MDRLVEIFQTNRIILYWIYGQVFFVLGLAALLRSHKYSRLALGRSLWMLGVFGVLHGLSEWAYVFVPIQEVYLPIGLIVVLWLIRILIEATSFAFLFQFGATLLEPMLERRWLRLLPAAIFVLWGCIFLYVAADFRMGLQFHFDTPALTVGDIWARYLLASPAGILVAVGLLRQTRTVQAMELPHITRYLRWSAGSFLAYTGLAGLLVPQAQFFPADVVNYDLLWVALGVPVPVFRSVCGLAIAYFTVRALEVFDVEMDRMIERMEHAQMIAVERERIGRELHDGTIQSIYGAGLALEDAALTIGKDAELARQKVRQVMESLNGTIGGIRTYILDLHDQMANREFEDQLNTLSEEFRARTGVRVQVDVTPTWRRPFTAEQAAHLLQVARETLSNAARHAEASRVEILLSYSREAVTLEVRDDGRGFDPTRVAKGVARGESLGLRNLARRMEMLGGSLRIQTALGAGTRVSAQIPLGKETE